MYVLLVLEVSFIDRALAFEVLVLDPKDEGLMLFF